MSWRDRLLNWVEPKDNLQNTVYGTLAAGLVIAAENPATETYPRVALATVVAVTGYWLAHGYAHWVAQRLQLEPGSGWSVRGLLHALVHEWPLLEGAAVPLAALVAAWLAGVRLATGATAAVWTGVAALVFFEISGGLRRRLRPRHIFGDAAVGIALAAALLAVKMLLR